MQEEEDIIDLIYEVSSENKFIFFFLLLLSKGTLMYFEYNTTTKKCSNLFTNTALSMITNELTCAELSFNSPIIVATSLNELILVETQSKPCQMINATEEGITICSEPCDSQIISIKFNCNQSTILVITTSSIKIFRIAIDKIENKRVLQFFTDIEIYGYDNQNIDYSTLLGTKLFPKFSDFYENTMIISYITNKPTCNDPIRLSVDSDELSENNTDVFYLNLIKINLSKKDYSMLLVQCYCVDKTFVKIEFSYFYEKVFVLFEGGVVCCVNCDQLNSEYNKKEEETNSNIVTNTMNSHPHVSKVVSNTFDDKLVFKYPLNSPNVKFTDVYVHPSSNFIVVRDSQSTFLIFDFTLNLYYIMFNSKITVKLNMDSFDSSEGVNCLKFKPYELNYFTKNHHMNSQWIFADEFKIDKDLKNVISSEKMINNSMFFYNSRVINGIFIEISSKFNQKNTLNPILDEFQLLKNHLRGQNFDSSFKILTVISNLTQWIYSLFLITNKLCHHPQNILLIKRHSLTTALQYLKEKTFNDEDKNSTIANIRNLCFTNIVLRCMSIRQYEYAFLIIDKLNMNSLLKLLVAHCKLTRFLGINYLASSKLEESSENEDNVINELNKIITSTNFTLSQNNMQLLIKDVNELIETENLNTEYLKEYNSLEINLQSKHSMLICRVL